MTLMVLYGMIFDTAATAQVIDYPCGIYSLDNSKGGISESGLQFRDENIRDYPFIKGYAWRTAWPNIEISKGKYDFSAIDHIIKKLELINQKLSLSILPGEPEYVMNNEGSITWHNRETKAHGDFVKFRTGKRVVPWDPYLNLRFAAFIEALSKHEVYSIKLKQKVPLASHPTLGLINTGIPGYGALRENKIVRISNIPGYSRKKLTKTVLESIDKVRTFFPNQNYMIGFWKLKDGEKNPSLSEHLRVKILNEFDGMKKPKVGFFQENLAASRNKKSIVTGYPRTAFAEPLFNSKHETYIGFQALHGWKRPFRNKAKTANASPVDGIKFAMETYNSKYFELYVSDLDEQKNHQELLNLSKTLCLVAD